MLLHLFLFFLFLELWVYGGTVLSLWKMKLRIDYKQITCTFNIFCIKFIQPYGDLIYEWWYYAENCLTCIVYEKMPYYDIMEPQSLLLYNFATNKLK